MKFLPNTRAYIRPNGPRVTILRAGSNRGNVHSEHVLCPERAAYPGQTELVVRFAYERLIRTDGGDTYWCQTRHLTQTTTTEDTTMIINTTDNTETGWPGKAITTRYAGPTDRTGSRVITRSACGSYSHPWDHSKNSEANHIAAIREHIQRRGWPPARWAIGSAPSGSGYVAVMLTNKAAP